MSKKFTNALWLSCVALNTVQMVNLITKLLMGSGTPLTAFAAALLVIINLLAYSVIAAEVSIKKSTKEIR